MLATYLIIIFGLVVLIAGGEFLVRGASQLALRIRISPLVVGLTVVAFGTSAPELLISIKSALSGSPDLAMGNVVGSNICNLSLVLGLMAVISPIEVNKDSVKIDWPMTMGSSLLLYFLVREGIVNKYEGIIFLVILASYIYYIINRSRKNSVVPILPIEELSQPVKSNVGMLRELFFVFIGCIGLYFGSDLFVSGAQTLAIDLGVNERVIGLTVLAVGTSLPELVTSVVAAIKKKTDIAIGNLLGSNIFNILSILGITSIIKEIRVSELIVKVDMLWMLGITFLVLPMMLYKKTIIRWEGIILLLLYIFYTYTVIN